MPTAADGNLVNLLLIPGGIGTVLLATLAGWRKGPAAKPVEATVVSGALADSAAIRELTEELVRHRRALCDDADRAHRDAELSRDSVDELAREIREDRDERRRQTFQPPDWALALLAKLDGNRP